MRAVAVTPVPNVPAPILGMVNVGGSIMPVVSLRKLYGLPERELDVNDQFIIVRSEQSLSALVVDEVSGVASCRQHQIVGADTIVPGLDGLRVIVESDGEIIVLHENNLLPDLGEMAQLESALRGTV